MIDSHNLELPSENLKLCLEKMYHVLSNLVRPDGTFPEINDGFIRWKYKRLANTGKKLNRKDFIFIGTNGQHGIPPRKASIGFKDAGFYVMRSDWSQKAKYLLFDGTYFHKNGCLAILMDYRTKNSLSYTYMDKESYHNVYPMLRDLKEEGLYGE